MAIRLPTDFLTVFAVMAWMLRVHGLGIFVLFFSVGSIGGCTKGLVLARQVLMT
jgi:hypothetical protein